MTTIDMLIILSVQIVLLLVAIALEETKHGDA